MTLRSRAEFPYVDYKLTYEVDGKMVTMTGKARAQLDNRSEYQDIYYDSLSPSMTVPVTREVKVTLDLLYDKDSLYTIKTTDLEKPVETVKRTIKVGVPDKTFASLSNARKRAGVPREATFSFVDLNPRYEGDTGFGDSTAYVEFAWTDTLA
jgi:hypothetical protein